MSVSRGPGLNTGFRQLEEGGHHAIESFRREFGDAVRQFADFLIGRLAAAAVGDEKQCVHVKALPFLWVFRGYSLALYINCT